MHLPTMQAKRCITKIERLEIDNCPILEERLNLRSVVQDCPYSKYHNLKMICISIGKFTHTFKST